MQESTKDKIEYVVAVGAEAAFSALPIVGGPLATIFGHTIENAQARRNARLLDEIRVDLDRLIADGSVSDIEDVLQSDLFLANLTTAFRAMQATADEERIGQLRQAVIKGVRPKWRSRSERFTNSVVRLTPIHIQVLSVIVSLSAGRPKSIQDGTAKVRDELSHAGIHRNEASISHICDELAVEGFLVGSPSASTEQEGRRVRLTGEGVSFHAFIVEKN